VISSATPVVVACALVPGAGIPAWAAAPDPTTLVTLASGATATVAAPVLQVRATDADGDPQQVGVGGRRLGAARTS